jgi:hypothetical protein
VTGLELHIEYPAAFAATVLLANAELPPGIARDELLLALERGDVTATVTTTYRAGDVRVSVETRKEAADAE